MKNAQSEATEDFARKRIGYGSIVQTGGFNTYRKPLSKGYTHERKEFNPGSNLLKWFHHMIGNAETFINGTYHDTSTKHLQMHLSEFSTDSTTDSLTVPYSP